jgi:hypothetical protein
MCSRLARQGVHPSVTDRRFRPNYVSTMFEPLVVMLLRGDLRSLVDSLMPGPLRTNSPSGARRCRFGPR